jgi:hypothetical protein
VVALDLQRAPDRGQDDRLVVDDEDRAASHRGKPTRRRAELTNVPPPFRFQP